MNRRRLLQRGLAATPVLLTLVSRPVLGNCTTMSGMYSGGSHPGKHTRTCIGRTPGYWKQQQHFNAWPSPYYPQTVPGVGNVQATKFHPCFAGSQFAGKTLLLVLDPTNTDKAGLARHCVAALLNAQAGKTSVLTVANVKNIWSEYTAMGYYEPTAGVKWYPDNIVAYLKTTMPL